MKRKALKDKEYWDPTTEGVDNRDTAKRLAIKHGDVSNKIPIRTDKRTVIYVTREKAELLMSNKISKL